MAPIRFDPVNPDFKIALISSIKLGSEIEITNVRFGEGTFGEYAVISLAEIGDHRSSNKAILGQLHRIKEVIDEEEDSVIVKFNRVKGASGFKYYVFEKADDKEE